jgi:putative membrane protein
MLAAILDTSEVNDPMSDFHPGALLNAIVYAALGILIFAAAFVTIDKMTPYHLWKEIVEDKNVALAVLVGAMSIGMCIIIAAAVH